MSIANAAATAMLSDALLQEGSASGTNRLIHLELELPLDKVIKFVSVGLPLLLVSMACAREMSVGQSVFVEPSCFFDQDLFDQCFCTYLTTLCRAGTGLYLPVSTVSYSYRLVKIG